MEKNMPICAPAPAATYTLKGWSAAKGPRALALEVAAGRPKHPSDATYTLKGYAQAHGVRAHALALGYC